MDELFMRLLKQNKKAVKDELDHIFDFIHCFIIHHIPQREVRKMLFFKKCMFYLFQR
jgi:hypothetical protein